MHPGFRCLFVAVLGLAPAVVPVAAAADPLEVEWRGPAEAVQGFVIERRPAGEVRWSPIARLGPEATRFLDEVAGDGDALCYRVRAILYDGSWAPSLEQCGPTEPELAGDAEPIAVPMRPDVAAPPPALEEPTAPKPAGPARDADAAPPKVSDRFRPEPPTTLGTQREAATTDPDAAP